MKVFLDDRRVTPAGWARAYWPDEAITLLETGQVRELSLCGDLDDARRGTGNTVLEWIEEAVAQRGFTPPKINVHGAAAEALERIERGIAAIARLHRENLISSSGNRSDADLT